MKMKRLMNAVLGIALATAPMLFGDEAPKAKETKSAAEAVKPA